MQEDRYEEAELLIKTAVNSARAELGERNPVTLELLSNLGILNLHLRQIGEAERLFRHVLELRRQTLGNNNLSTATALSNLASAYLSLGKYDDAEPFLAEALQISRDLGLSEDDSFRDTYHFEYGDGSRMAEKVR